MKTFAYLALLGLANCFDASTAYDVTEDSDTKYITLAPKDAHNETLLYLHGGGMSASVSYSYVLKSEQIASLSTKVIILNAPIGVTSAKGTGYLWFNDVPKGTGYTDDLGNDIVAVQDGEGSIDSITRTLMDLIDTEKNALPEGKQSYANIKVVGFSQGAATTVALLSKWDKPEPI